MDKKNIIFHLKVKVISTRFGRLKEKDSFYSDIFFTHEKA